MNDPWVQKFRSEALPALVKTLEPERVLLFGPRVRGDARVESDLDMIIVSQHFREIPFVKRMGCVTNNVPFPKHVDYLCYTPEEFAKIRNESIIVRDALEYAVELPI